MNYSRIFDQNHSYVADIGTDQDKLPHRDGRVQKDLLHGMGASHSWPCTWGRVSIECRSVKETTLIGFAFSFVIPTIYYLSRYRLPRLLQAKLVLLGAGIGFQGVLGWYMVKSGLDQEIIETNAVPRVSQYRLAAHLSAALALYIGMIHTALTLSKDRALQTGLSSSGPHRRWTEKQLEMLSSPAIGRYRGIARLALAMVFLTAVSGAFVAGLDAGLVYNEFPTMGGRLVPPNEELMDPRYGKRKDGGDRWWRNLLENPVTAQFDHRLLVSTD